MTAQFSLPQTELVRRASTRAEANIKTMLKPTNPQYSSFVATATDPLPNQQSDEICLIITDGNFDPETLSEPTPWTIKEFLNQTYISVLALGYLFSVCWLTFSNPILSSKMALYLIGIFEVVMVICIYYTCPSGQTVAQEENNKSENRNNQIDD